MEYYYKIITINLTVVSKMFSFIPLFLKKVRLQELFRDRKTALEVTLKHMETHFERMAQVK